MNNGSTKMLIVLITLILTVANTCNAQMMVGGISHSRHRIQTTWNLQVLPLNSLSVLRLAGC